MRLSLLLLITVFICGWKIDPENNFYSINWMHCSIFNCKFDHEGFGWIMTCNGPGRSNTYRNSYELPDKVISQIKDLP